MTDSDLLHLLHDCYAPGSRINIVAAGLVLAATVAPDHQAPGANIPNVPTRFIATIRLTEPASGGEEAAEHLRAHILNRLAGVPTLSRTELTFAPALFRIL